MPKVHKHWKVLPHGALTEVDEGVLTVTGELRMPLGSFPRRMVVVRVPDARLIIWSAIALDPPGMDKIEAYGRPTFLVVPNELHRLDAHVWKERYPQLTVVAPPGARAKVGEVVLVDTATPDFADGDVTFVTVPGTDQRESALVVRKPRGTTLVLNDLVGNIRDASGIRGWFLRMAGFAGDAPRVPRVVKRKLVADAEALRVQLMRWAELPNLCRILVSHGEPIERDVPGALRDMAHSL
jgi:hypothetical protein